MIDASQALFFLLLWLTGVLLHGLIRSSGESKQDPIRPSGPIGVFDEDSD